MKTHTLAAICTTLALSATPVWAEQPTFSGIEVNVDLSDYANSNALEYWPDLERDLTAAIVAHSKVDDEAEAPKIEVTVNSVAVDGDTYLPDSGEFNQLSGTIEVMRGGGENPAGTSAEASANDLLRNYFVKVTAVSGDAVVPDGWVVIPPSQDDFYNAMVEAFAMEVVENFEG